MYQKTLILTLCVLLLVGAATTVSAEPECIDLAGSGVACHDIGEDSGSVTVDAADDDLGVSVSVSVTYSIG